MINVVAIKPTTLKTTLASDDAIIQLKDFVDRDGNTPEWADLETDWIVLVVKQADKWEQIKCDGLTQNADGSATLDIATNGRHMLPIPPFTGSATGSSFSVADVIVGADMYTMQIFGNITKNMILTGYWEAPDPISAQGIVTRDYMLALISGGTISTDKITVDAIAGETVTLNDLLYFDLTDNEWKKTDANTLASIEGVLLGIAMGSGTDGNAIVNGVLIKGKVSGQTGLTQGDLLYASDTAGAFSSTAGTNEKVIGIAKSSTEIYFDPFFYYLLGNSAKLALVGGEYILGSELLSSSNWTSTGWTGDFASGFKHNTGNVTALLNSLAGVVGNLYKIELTITERTNGSIIVEFGGMVSSSITASTSFRPKAQTTGTFKITPTTDFDGKIVISIKVATGDYFGTPSGTNKFLTRDFILSDSILPKKTIISTPSTKIGDYTSRYDITNPSGSTFRYTYDGTGTNPNITAVTIPVGTVLYIQSPNMSAGNCGFFEVTGSGSNYFEITNASGVVESDKVLGTQYLGFILKGSKYSKPTNLKWLEVEVQGGGESGGDHGSTSKQGGGHTAFKSIFAKGGGSITTGIGGVATGGDINIDGKDDWSFDGFLASDSRTGKSGKPSFLGKGGKGNIGYQESSFAGVDGAGGSGSYYNNSGQGGYGGASGAYSKKAFMARDLNDTEMYVVGFGGSWGGGDGGAGKIIITEHYS